ncbi:hypothetical protein IJ670_03065, partial [bacterium]|nr:hypothetical protein [bacterium]
MENMEEHLLKKLSDLKENYFAIALKSEFQAENTSEVEFGILKDFTNALNLDFSVKIGGQEALSDIVKAKKANTSSIVCPMIESVYAVEKYLKNLEKAEFSNDIYINIETISGFHVLDDILNSKF